jgi:hypothetical protein
MIVRGPMAEHSGNDPGRPDAGAFGAGAHWQTYGRTRSRLRYVSYRLESESNRGGRRGIGVRRVEKDDLFRLADVLSIHVQLSDRTRGLVTARELALMKPEAYLINTSRGPPDGLLGEGIFKARDTARQLLPGLSADRGGCPPNAGECTGRTQALGPAPSNPGRQQSRDRPTLI